MYIPNHFKVSEKEEIYRFIRAHSFGQLITRVEGRLYSSHIPFLLLPENDRLVAHVAKANPQWHEIEEQEVLLTLQGDHDYVSPSWYVKPGVPTWNYQALHIYAECKVVDNDSVLADIVEALAREYESAFTTPWQVEYPQKMLQAIVGLEFEIKEIQCKYKLSQNRSRLDQEKVAEHFNENGSEYLAHLMRKNLKGNSQDKEGDACE